MKLTQLFLDELDREARRTRRALEAGASAYIQKPIENREFLAAIERALGKSSGVGSKMT